VELAVVATNRFPCARHLQISGSNFSQDFEFKKDCCLQSISIKKARSTESNGLSFQGTFE